MTSSLRSRMPVKRPRMPLTARAIAVLEEILMDPNHGAAAGLSARLGEGRDAIQTAITDLKEIGFLEVVTNRLENGKIVSTLQVTATGNQFLETRIHILQNRLNPNSNLILDINTDLLSYKPNRDAKEKEEMEYEDTPTFIDPEDIPKLKEMARARKHEEKMQRHEARFKKWMAKRDPDNASDWSATDSGFEFAHQMHLLWHVAPWKVTRSKFIYALDDKRTEYNTDGAVERQMMIIFFDKIKHDTRINDPELIWRRFIAEFHNLLEQVKRETVTVEDVEKERERSQKSRRQLRVQE